MRDEDLAPNVLSREEAEAILAWVADEDDGKQSTLAEEVFDRLRDWSEA